MQHWPADWVSMAMTDGAAAYEAGQRLARQDDLTLTDGIQTGTVSLEKSKKDAPPPTVAFTPFQEARSRLLEARYGEDFARYQAEQQAHEKRMADYSASLRKTIQEAHRRKLSAQAVNPHAD